MNEQLPKTLGGDLLSSRTPKNLMGVASTPPPPPLYVRALRFLFFRPLRGVHLFQSNQRLDAIEFLDKRVSEKL